MTAPDCSSVRAALDARLDGPLPPARAAFVDHHVAACPACAAVAAELEGLDTLLAAAPVPSVPAGFAAAVVARLDRGPAPAAPAAPSTGGGWRTLVAGAVSTAVGAAGLLLLPGTAAAEMAADWVPPLLRTEHLATVLPATPDPFSWAPVAAWLAIVPAPVALAGAGVALAAAAWLVLRTGRARGAAA